MVRSEIGSSIRTASAHVNCKCGSKCPRDRVVATISRLYIVMTASSNHRCSIERSPNDILAMSVTNSP